MRAGALGAVLIEDLSPRARAFITQATLRREFHLTTGDIRALPRREVRRYTAYLEGLAMAQKEASKRKQGG